MGKEIIISKKTAKHLPFNVVAKVGDVIEFVDRKLQVLLYGKVISVLENSVVVDLTIMQDFPSLNIEYERTVVSHRRYKISKVPVA